MEMMHFLNKAPFWSNELYILHLLALDNLGFGDYCEEAQAIVKEAKAVAAQETQSF